MKAIKGIWTKILHLRNKQQVNGMNSLKNASKCNKQMKLIK